MGDFSISLSRQYSDTDGTALYEVLGLPKDATGDEIKQTYRRLALRFHPDKNPEDPSAADQFKDINKAHKILSDPVKRRIYDMHGPLGLRLAENFGEENIKYYFMLSSWWCRTLFGISCILTGFCCCCCLCFCCNCCCGRCGPKVSLNKEDHIPPNAEDLAAEEDADPVTTQPTSGSSKQEGKPDNNGNNGIPPVTRSAPIELGPPPTSASGNANMNVTASSPPKSNSYH